MPVISMDAFADTYTPLTFTCVDDHEITINLDFITENSSGVQYSTNNGTSWAG